jgi:hypothetical protein
MTNFNFIPPASQPSHQFFTFSPQLIPMMHVTQLTFSQENGLPGKKLSVIISTISTFFLHIPFTINC